MSESEQGIDLKTLTVKEHLILLNEKLRDIKEDTEALKGNDKNKWKAIRDNESRINELYSNFKIYIAIFGIIFTGAVATFWKLLCQ